MGDQLRQCWKSLLLSDEFDLMSNELGILFINDIIFSTLPKLD